MRDRTRSDMFQQAFSDPEAVARYTDGPRRFVPGLADLHRMAGILLAEHAPADAHVLVLGAGGGLELTALAQAQAGWTFEGVDPAAEMLKLAARTMGPDAHRATLREGYIEDASEGPFDAAVCLLTLHFLDADERLSTVREIHRRLKRGAPFVIAHSSLPKERAERDLWLTRYMAFAVASGADPAYTEKAREAVDKMSGMLPSDTDPAILEAAGFSNVTQFYQGFTWRGWIAYA